MFSLEAAMLLSEVSPEGGDLPEPLALRANIPSNPRALIERIVARYRSLRSYSDRGTVRDLSASRDAVRFSTAYRQPTKFRFEFESPHPYGPLRHKSSRCQIGHDGGAPYFWSCSYDGEKKLERQEPFDLVVAGATGISRASAHTIAALLFPSIGGLEFLRLKSIRSYRGKVVCGVPCLGVTAKHPAGGRIDMFFGQRDLLLRRLDYRRFKQSQTRRVVRTSASHANRKTFAAPSVD